MKTTKTKSSSYEFFAGNVVFAAIFIICACADANAQSWSASPDPSWNSSDPAKMVFDSDSDGTLDSTVATQSNDSSVGLSGAVSLEKRGTGTLTVNGMHSFTGNIDIYGGTYLVGSGTTDKGAARNSQLGDPRTERKITVYTNATLQLSRTGVFGAGTAGGDGIKTDVEIRGGTLTLPAKSCTAFGNLLFHNATINANEGADPKWPLFCLTGDWLAFSSDEKRHMRSPTTIKAVFSCRARSRSMSACRILPATIMPT
jgi:autotransporter-associated beta strand protein